jgi:hypothetical protein
MRVLATAAIALVAIAGCDDHSGDRRLSKDRWIEQADEICEQEKDEQGELQVPDADPFDDNLTAAQLTAIADYLQVSLEVQDRATDRLDGIGLPDEDTGDIEEVAIDAARAGDADRFAVNYRQAVTDYGKASQAAREFGLQECGQP